MKRTMAIAALAFAFGTVCGALLLNQRSAAAQELLVPVVQEPAPQPPQRNPDQPNRGANANPFQQGRAQQPVRVPVASPMQLSASGKFVYILRGNEILQFHAETMEFVKKVNVPPPERPNPPPPPRDGDERRDRVPPAPPPREPDGE